MMNAPWGAACHFRRRGLCAVLAVSLSAQDLDPTRPSRHPARGFSTNENIFNIRVKRVF
jgi:hypothetical protein